MPIYHNGKKIEGIKIINGDTGQEEIERLRNIVIQQKEILDLINVTLDDKIIAAKLKLLQEKSVSPTSSQQEIIPDDGYEGLSKVIVEEMKIDGINLDTYLNSIKNALAAI